VRPASTISSRVGSLHGLKETGPEKVDCDAFKMSGITTSWRGMCM